MIAIIAGSGGFMDIHSIDIRISAASLASVSWRCLEEFDDIASGFRIITFGMFQASSCTASGGVIAAATLTCTSPLQKPHFAS